MYWGIWANVILPFGVFVLLLMALPLHKKMLRAPVQSFVGYLLEIQFFNLKFLGEKVTLFQAIIFISGFNFLMLSNPMWKHEYEYHDFEEMIHKIGRWRRERNMYISSFCFVTYLMIHNYHKLRNKYDSAKLKLARMDKKVQ